MMLTTLWDLLAKQAHAQGGATALIETRPTARRLTFAAWLSEVERMAAALRSELAPGDRVLIWLDKRLEAAILPLVANRLGAIFILLHPGAKPQLVQHIIADASPRLIATSKARAALLDLSGFVALDRDLFAAADPDPALLFAQRCPAKAPLSFWQSSKPLQDDAAAIFYTSGSSGFPKGVVVPHRTIVLGAESVVHFLGLCEAHTLAALLPLAFDAGFSQLSTALYAGAQLILHDYFSAASALRILAQHRVDVLVAVPLLWRQLLDVAHWPEAFAATLRIAASTGGMMPPAWVTELQRRAPQLSFTVMYGLTEAFRASYLPSSEWAKRPYAIGIPIPHADLLVLDERGSLCAPGVVGEIVQRGPLLALGYWNDPERTAERFRLLPPNTGHPLQGFLAAERVLFTGDYGYRDEEGFFYFVGRRDAQIKTRGFRVSPEEVEAVLLMHEAVLECCVCGVADQKLGEAIVALVRVADDCEPETLLRHCRQHLSSHQIPRHLVLEKRPLARTINGKLDREGIAAELSMRFAEK